MSRMYDSAEGIRALHVVSAIPQHWLEHASDGNQADPLVVGFLLELYTRMNFASGVDRNDSRPFISALVRDPLVVAFCRAAVELQRRESGTVQAETLLDVRTMSYIVKIGLFYTPAELQRMRTTTPLDLAASPAVPTPPPPVQPAPRRLSLRGLKSISTGVADPKTRP